MPFHDTDRCNSRAAVAPFLQNTAHPRVVLEMIRPMDDRRQTRFVVVAIALTVGGLVAEHPSNEPAAVFPWIVANLVLVALAHRGRRGALTLITALSVIACSLLLTGGSAELTSHPRIFASGVAYFVAAYLLVRLRRDSRSLAM